MADATQIVTYALRRLNVIGAGESPSSQEETDATYTLNAMIQAWEADNLSGDTLPLDARFEQGLTALLAVRLAEDYGVTPGPVLIRDAKRGQQQIDAAFFAVPTQSNDLAYTNRRYSTADLEGNATNTRNLDPWQSNTNYPIRHFATLNGNVYEVTTAGISGTTGPTGTGIDIADGTVVWAWRRVSG